MHINKYFDSSKNWYIDPKNETCWGTAEEFIQGSLLNFCCCGKMELNLKFIAQGLNYINNLRKVWNKIIKFEDWTKEGNKLFNSEGSKYFFFYWAYNKKLTEHGSIVPGWLTNEGYELLEDLNELYDLHLNIIYPITKKKLIFLFLNIK